MCSRWTGRTLKGLLGGRTLADKQLLNARAGQWGAQGPRTGQQGLSTSGTCLAPGGVATAAWQLCGRGQGAFRCAIIIGSTPGPEAPAALRAPKLH